MKKTLNRFSIIATVLITLGALFKFMHWPAAGLFLMFSMGFLSFGFIPVYAKSKLHELNDRKSKFTFGLGYFCLSVFNLGVLFKIMHWQFASILIVLPLALFGLIFLPLYTIHKARHSDTKTEKRKNIIGGTYFSMIVLGLLFKFQHWPFGNELLIIGVLLFLLVYLPLLLKSLQVNDDRKTTSLTQLTFITLLMTTLVAFLFNNSSKMFMNSFALTQENAEQISFNINARNENVFTFFQKDNSLKQKAIKIRDLSNNLFNYISDMKAHLICATDGIAKEAADSISPYDINAKDNFDIPTRILVGDMENPREGNFSGSELKNKIAVYKEDILGMIANDKRSKIEKTLGLSIADKYDHNNEWTYKWEITNFYNIPLSGVLNVLTQLQNTIRLAENDALNCLKDESIFPNKSEEVK